MLIKNRPYNICYVNEKMCVMDACPGTSKWKVLIKRIFVMLKIYKLSLLN